MLLKTCPESIHQVNDLALGRAETSGGALSKALIAVVFGFGGMAAGAAGISKVVFVMFLIGAVVSFLIHGRGRL